MSNLRKINESSHTFFEEYLWWILSYQFFFLLTKLYCSYKTTPEALKVIVLPAPSYNPHQQLLMYIRCKEDLPPERPSGVNVAPPPVGSTSGLFPLIEFTLNSPSFPSFTASLSVMITSCSFVVELNFSARSTIILPHL